MNTVVIAEIGENHCGDMNLARAMIRFASANGADIVKFQAYNPACIKEDDFEKEWINKTFIPDEEWYKLKEVAEERKIGFLASPFSLERLHFLVEGLGLREIKVASCMMYNGEFLLGINKLYKKIDKVYLSTGMATVDEIDDALTCLSLIGEIVVMHCVSLYPCPNNLANLSCIKSFKEHLYYKYPIGYSDHCKGFRACIMAVVLGATVIEKHFTMDKNYPEGTDHILSVDPLGLRKMVDSIREIERMLGDGLKQPNKRELEWKDKVKERFVV